MNPQPINEVYDKFMHLDKCLSDTEWCNNGTAIYSVAGEMWRAIKEARGEE